MMQQTARALADGQRDFTVDSSKGGSVLAAEVVAALIRGHNGSLTATGRCRSACALMLLAVDRKYVAAEADVRIHGASNPKQSVDNGKAAEAAAGLLIKHGVPADIANTRGKGTNLCKLTPVELSRRVSKA